MTVWVDEVTDYGNSVKGAARRWGSRWSHLSCGGDCEELHAMAARLGLKRSYAQHMDRADHFWHHYDCIPSKRELALKLGAVFKSKWDAAREFRRRQDAALEA